MAFGNLRRTRPVPAGVAIAALVLATALAPTAVAADPGQRPVTADDEFFGYAGAEYTIDVLANDTTSFLSSGDLSLCGVSVGDQVGRSVYAEIDRDDPSLVFVETNRNAEGTVEFSYDACQGNQRETATVKLTIDRLAPLRVVRLHQRGRLAVRNPNDVKVAVVWGSNRSASGDGKRGVPAGGSIKIAVKRKRIAWVGYLRDRGATVIAGDGTVTNIKLPRKRRSRH
ncbi:hypothetical protein BH11ACT8_BH11ACT8_31950 [soil metagenome]